jgi:hypothetical protein
MNNHDEFIIGTEDRVFRMGNEWFWQARGSSDCYGPFKSQAEAETDYYVQPDDDELRAAVHQLVNDPYRQ